MAADPEAVARIATILRKHLAGAEWERITLAAAEIGAALAPAGAVSQGRHARLGPNGRTGELPDRIFALLLDGAPRTVSEICDAIAMDSVSRKQVYNGLGYLIRRREIERLGHACYQRRLRSSGPSGAAA